MDGLLLSSSVVTICLSKQKNEIFK
jgi:hypothetical protein